ncbi:PD-(D/E)XK nuclease family protein [Streptomyces sp. NBC_00704]|uniref:hypothetical protein n=1 Tax=Streptomyces sp. NBC_00704 TaxID=2975809 RepID=UPI002E316740|nr:hypothetical protein [Streptomyces sp. NBC_00704]
MERGELIKAFAVESTVNSQAKSALAAGASFEIWPGRMPAARLHHTYARRLRRLQKLERPSLGFEEAVANLEEIGNQELLVGFIDDRERGEYRFIVFLSADLTRVIACIGLIVPLPEVLDPDVTNK